MNTVASQSCISERELGFFVLGQLATDRHELVSVHVDSCSDCQDTVMALAEQSDTFVGTLRDVPTRGTSGFEQELALQSLMRRLTSEGVNLPKATYDTAARGTNNRIGPYILDRQLGSGGMGTVYLATHSRLKRRVAIKVLPHHRWANAAAISRFEREMEAIGGLNHDNIVAASDAGEDDGLHFLAMEYVDGLDLSSVVRRLGPLSAADVCEIGRQTALGLQHAHDCGLIHRDVKPSNLMLARPKSGNVRCGQQLVKILDLGLALPGDEHLIERDDLTTVGQLMGTLDYMSPEQGCDSHHVDHRTDIYGLGATMYKLLTGKAPFSGAQHNTLMKKMNALATKPVPPIRSVRKDISEEVATIVDRMLVRNPAHRYESAHDVANALRSPAEKANLASLLSRALDAPDPAPRSAASPSAPRNTSVINQGSVRHGRTGRRARVALALAGFVCIAGIAFWIATDYGEITVTSDDPNATVVLKNGNKAVKELSLTHDDDNRFHIRSGDYEIEVKGDNTRVSVSPKQLSISRGHTSDIRIAATEPATAAMLPQTQLQGWLKNPQGTQFTMPDFPSSNEQLGPISPYAETSFELRLHLERLDLIKRRLLQAESELRAFQTQSIEDILQSDPSHQSLKREADLYERSLEAHGNEVQTVESERVREWRDNKLRALAEDAKQHQARKIEELQLEVHKHREDFEAALAAAREQQSPPSFGDFEVIDPQDPVFEGRTYGQWLKLLRHERQIHADLGSPGDSSSSRTSR